MKTCSFGNCTNPAFSKGRCKWHMKRKRIASVSKKKKAAKLVYSSRRVEFLLKRPTCQICHQNRSTEVHHKYAGADREKYLNDTSTWMAVCRDCHQNKIHLDPVNARKNGWLK